MRVSSPAVALVLSLGLLLAPVAGSARADVPRAMAERQRPEATHIVRGRVTQIYTAERRAAGEADTACLVEVAVDKVDKGKGPSTDKPLYVRGWKSKIPDDFGFGRVWVYFRANRDGGYDLLEPNGIEVFEPTKP